MIGRVLRDGASSEPVRFGARAGLLANGLLHLLVAWLAVRVAFGERERADQVGALRTVATEPFGRALLWLLAIGFAAVVLWRGREAIWGFPGVTDRRVQLRKRLFSVGQLAVFGVMAGLAGRIATGSPGGGGGQALTARLLQLPFGPALVVTIGAGVLITGVVVGVRGWRRAFTEDMALGQAHRPVRVLAVRCGQLGALARGMAVGIIGGLVAVAGLTYQPAKAEGLDAALKTLAGQPYGTVLLVAVAAGLASHGIFCFFDARYHRV